MSQRFSDAELAAEYWAAYSDHVRDSAQVLYEKGALDNKHIMSGFKRNIERAETLYRFATLPHAHEEGPETVYAFDTQGNCIGTLGKPIPTKRHPRFEVMLKGDTK